MQILFRSILLLLMFTGALFNLASCAKSDDSSQIKNIFGNTPRSVANMGTAEMGLIGYLATPNNHACTASLVFRNIILTAAHCISDHGTLLKGDYNFYLGYDSGTRIADAKVTQFSYGALSPQAANGADWALLRLDRDLSSNYFGTGVYDGVRDLVIAGYGKNFENGTRLTTYSGCSVRQHFSDGSIYHDCPAAPGDSGAPIFTCRSNGCSIVALHKGAYQAGSLEAQYFPAYADANANIGVSVQSFGATLIRMQQQL